MYGNDIERILVLVCGINKTAITRSEALDNIENLPVSTNPHTNSIVSYANILQVEVNKINKIVEKAHTAITRINNSYGSPYTEIYNLQNKLNACMNFAYSHPTIEYSYEKNELVNLMRSISLLAIDTKYAIITYQDYLQKGYDSIINKK
jgi:plasmid maintenance system antidote protein VapI